MRSGTLKKASRNVASPAYQRGDDKSILSSDSRGESSNRKSLSDIAYERLLSMLRFRDLRPNDLIMERQIARHLRLSRTPLREAIRRLEGENILERQRNGSLIVKALSIEDLLHIWLVRILVEGEAARRAAGKIFVHEISVHEPNVLRKRLLLIKNNKKGSPDAQRNFTLARDLHLWIAQASGNPVLASIIGELRNRSELLTVRRVPDRLVQSCNEHLAIVDAVLAGNGDEARIAMQRHIENTRRYTLEKLGAL
jgi:DNA-binding GntR family transcriptional regulator